jgi:hypothetical protein
MGMGSADILLMPTKTTIETLLRGERITTFGMQNSLDERMRYNLGPLRDTTRANALMDNSRYLNPSGPNAKVCESTAI